IWQPAREERAVAAPDRWVDRPGGGQFRDPGTQPAVPFPPGACFLEQLVLSGAPRLGLWGGRVFEPAIRIADRQTVDRLGDLVAGCLRIRCCRVRTRHSWHVSNAAAQCVLRRKSEATSWRTKQHAPPS